MKVTAELVNGLAGLLRNSWLACFVVLPAPANQTARNDELTRKYRGG